MEGLMRSLTLLTLYACSISILFAAYSFALT
jgi:hypothetical protein